MVCPNGVKRGMAWEVIGDEGRLLSIMGFKYAVSAKLIPLIRLDILSLGLMKQRLWSGVPG